MAMLLGTAIILNPGLAHGRDLDFRLPSGLFVLLGGAVPALFVLGMRVELDGETISKIYFFGLLRESIPISRLGCITVMGFSRGGAYPVLRFMNLAGAGFFQLIPGHVWPAGQVAELARLGSPAWDHTGRPRRQNGATWVLLGAAAAAVYLVVLVWFFRAASHSAGQ